MIEKSTASTIDSPCIRNCCLDDNDICLGCFRSLQEIVGWGSATEERKREVLSQVEQRKIARGGLVSK